MNITDDLPPIPPLSFFKDARNRKRYGWPQPWEKGGKPEELRAFYERDRAVKLKHMLRQRQAVLKENTGLTVDELQLLLDQGKKQ